MKKIKFRVDKFTFAEIEASEMTASEQARRMARKIKKGVIPNDTGRCSKKGLEYWISADLTDSLANVHPNAIRNALVKFYDKENEPAKPNIDFDDVRNINRSVRLVSRLRRKVAGAGLPVNF